MRVAVDGGTNFIFDKLGKENQALPHLITGDFDSCRSDVADFFKSKVSRLELPVPAVDIVYKWWASWSAANWFL